MLCADGLPGTSIGEKGVSEIGRYGRLLRLLQVAGSVEGGLGATSSKRPVS